MKFIIKKLSKSNNFFINFANSVALISIAIGNIAVIISLSILNGFDTELRATARKFTADICVQTINGSEIFDVEQKSIVKPYPDIRAHPIGYIRIVFPISIRITIIKIGINTGIIRIRTFVGKCNYRILLYLKVISVRGYEHTRIGGHNFLVNVIALVNIHGA